MRIETGGMELVKDTMSGIGIGIGETMIGEIGDMMGETGGMRMSGGEIDDEVVGCHKLLRRTRRDKEGHLGAGGTQR